MTDVETSSPNDNLTGTTSTQESQTGSTEPTENKESKNWQEALQKSREREKAKDDELEKARQRLNEYQAREREEKLADMTEAEKYKSIAEEESQKRAKLELKVFISETIAGKEISRPIADLLYESPWAIPPVRKELGDDFTWDDAIASVRRHLPEYVESLLVSGQKPGSEEPLKRVDSERSVDTSGVSMSHVYTREEISRISADPKEWEKHRERVLSQLSKAGGVISE